MGGINRCPPVHPFDYWYKELSGSLAGKKEAGCHVNTCGFFTCIYSFSLGFSALGTNYSGSVGPRIFLVDRPCAPNGNLGFLPSLSSQPDVQSQATLGFLCGQRQRGRGLQAALRE